MARNFYEVLGVSKSATEKEIQKAYRDLARKYHPDLHPDDKDAAQKFSEVQEAFDTLNNKDKRAQYDQFGSNYQQFQQAGGAGFGGFHPGAGGAGGFSGEFDLNDILRQFGAGGSGGGFSGFRSSFSDDGGQGAGFGGQGFGGQGFGGQGFGGRRRQPPKPGKGVDVQAELDIEFMLAVKGGQTQLDQVFPNGQRRRLDVKVPAGIGEGKKIRLKGQGGPSPIGGVPGDLLITIHILPHMYYTRVNDDLILRLPITIDEAVNGATIDIPTPKGTVELKIPAGTSSDRRLKLRGLGVENIKGNKGDLYVEPRIILPDDLTDDDRAAAKKMASEYKDNPRKGLQC